jgi:hypothetical protein
MESKGSLPCSQRPATNPYPERDESNPPPPPPPHTHTHTHTHTTHLISQRFILILSSHLCLGLLSGLFPLGFLTRILYTFLISAMHTSCFSHLILLHLITLIIFTEKYELEGSSLSSFLQPPVASCLLGPNILLSPLFLNTLNLYYSLNVRDQVQLAE